jgi:hypothetical protein
MGHVVQRERPEKVPKWSREQFDDKVDCDTQLKCCIYFIAMKQRQRKTKHVCSEFREARNIRIYGTGDIIGGVLFHFTKFQN